MRGLEFAPMEAFDFGGEIAWRPTPELISLSNLQRFINAHGLGSLDELQRRSTADLDWFWNAVLKDLDIRFRQPYSRVLDLRSEEHTSELQSHLNLVCRLLLEKKK